MIANETRCGCHGTQPCGGNCAVAKAQNACACRDDTDIGPLRRCWADTWAKACVYYVHIYAIHCMASDFRDKRRNHSIWLMHGNYDGLARRFPRHKTHLSQRKMQKQTDRSGPQQQQRQLLVLILLSSRRNCCIFGGTIESSWVSLGKQNDQKVCAANVSFYIRGGGISELCRRSVVYRTSAPVYHIYTYV